MEIRRSYNRFNSTMGFPILVRWHLYIESGPWLQSLYLSIKTDTCLLGDCPVLVTDDSIKHVSQAVNNFQYYFVQQITSFKRTDEVSRNLTAQKCWLLWTSCILSRIIIAAGWFIHTVTVTDHVFIAMGTTPNFRWTPIGVSPDWSSVWDSAD